MFLQTSNARLEVLHTGDIRSLSIQDLYINQLFPNHVDTMAHNIFLRIREDCNYKVYPLVGKASGGQFAVTRSTNQLVYQGLADDISYKVVYTLAKDKWFIDLQLTPSSSGQGKVIDIIYGQDVGLAGFGHIQGNEAYNSQYIDHKVFDTDLGYVVCSRQNQWQAPEQSGFPMMQQGSFQRIRSFSTDGYPFYGLTYKINDKISALKEETLNNRIYQYEYAYTALQTEETKLTKVSCYTFYGITSQSIKTEIKAPISMDTVLEDYHTPDWDLLAQADYKNVSPVIPCIASLPFTEAEVNERYPAKHHVEKS
ncbi:MAG TPA: hypothetical protein DHW85_12570, partial [Lachnospiraceae bacterium]|nr:hypothetical protein [Lachnospiraceae bacterium]